MKRRPCLCPKPILWELNSFVMRTLSFVPINLHRFWPREYTFHGPLSLREWTIGKVKGEDRKKIHTAGTGRKTYIQAKKKKKHAHQVNQRILNKITRRVELTPHTSPFFFLMVLSYEEIYDSPSTDSSTPVPSDWTSVSPSSNLRR